MLDQIGGFYVLGEDNRTPLPATLQEWGMFFEDARRRLVKVTVLGDRWIGTIFLGFDNGINPDQPPLLWATGAFMLHPDATCPRPDTSRGELADSEFATYDEAIAYHDELVEKWKVPS